MRGPKITGKKWLENPETKKLTAHGRRVVKRRRARDRMAKASRRRNRSRS